ncbi:MAG TPA: polysaccharide biosynthesis protein [Candidatus Acidoferrales bacterium]|nr:polysaccharide biosynthesis protein [Candidatus Acidoferrales bacterium]
MHFRKAPRFLVLTIGYAAIVNLAYLAALALRFEGQIPARFWQGYLEVAPAFTLLSLLGFFLAGLYHGLWRYASTVTLFQIFKGVTLSAATLVGLLFLLPDRKFPTSLIVITWLVELVMVGAARFAWRLMRERVLGPYSGHAVPTLVIGADHTGVDLVQEMRRRLSGEESLMPVGFLDDDERLTGHLIEGLKVMGTIADLPAVLRDRHVEMVVVSDSDIPGRVLREIARVCTEADVRIKTLPGLSDLSHGSRPSLAQMRDIRIEDLLGREPVQLDLEEVGGFLRGQRVLVTGGGGSIGSELARQVFEFGPAELVLLDHAENGLYFVHNELLAQRPAFAVQAVVCDIRDAAGIEAVFQRFKPEVVFHAAAHKHVPLLEFSPREAVLNNVVGTRNLVDSADRHGTRKFVLISTDKAVNPTSVMGASKRVCEMLLQSASQRSATRFCAVRFGNVLGSDGSVVPLFQRQLQRGGPITVTHPEARRYFMTIPEAVRLVLQAGAMGRGGEVFLLDMGEQVRIQDLARQLVRLAGLREGEDIDIVFTGLRPGEKLHEELHSHSEKTRITRHERILTWELESRPEAALRAEVGVLVSVSEIGDPEDVKRHLHGLVPEYREPTAEDLKFQPSSPLPDVQLPAAVTEPPASRALDVVDSARQWLDVVAAAGLLAVSSPLWLALALEARAHGQREFLTTEVRIGRTRRHRQRRARGGDVEIDRRNIERRTQDLSGSPITCARFRSDLGAFGRWVACRRLDKLPWLLNVLRGDMALVGPKPEKEELVLRWQNLVPDYARRFTVRPGLTGLAQVSGIGDGDADGVVRRVHYDLFYVDHRSIVLDARTLLRTLAVVARRPRLAPPGQQAAANARPAA